MAIKIMVLCDVHGEKPCPKGAEIQSREIFDMFSGKKYKKDLCGPEWDKLIDSQEKIMYGTEPVKEEEPASTPAKSNGSKPKSNGRKEPHPYEPLILEIMTWHRNKGLDVPRGRFSTDRKTTVNFLKSPEGAKWKDWKPGMPVPK